jgi:hypothetical protein
LKELRQLNYEAIGYTVDSSLIVLIVLQ